MPVLLYADSIDTYSNERVRYTVTGINGNQKQAGRYAGQSILIFNSGFGETKYVRDLPKTTGKIRIGFDFKFTSSIGLGVPAADSMIVGLLTSSSVPTCVVFSKASRELTLKNYPSTLLDTSTSTLEWETWYYMNIDIDFTASTVDVYVNGSLEMSSSATLTGSVKFGLLHNSFGFKGTAIDNLCILDMDTGSTSPTQYRVDVAYAATLNENEWSLSTGLNSTVLLDETVLNAGAPIPDNNYVFTSTAFLKTSHYMSTPFVGTALGVQLVIAAKSVSLTSEIEPYAETSGTKSFLVASQPAVSSDWLQRLDVLSTIPTLGTLWEASSFQTTSFGVRLSVGGTQIQVSQIAVEKVTLIGAVAASRYYAKL